MAFFRSISQNLPRKLIAPCNPPHMYVTLNSKIIMKDYPCLIQIVYGKKEGVRNGNRNMPEL